MVTTRSSAKAAQEEASSGIPLAGVLISSTNLFSVAFFAMLFADHAGYIKVLDPEYRETGFCTATKSTNSFHSMEACFYVDCVCVLAVLMLEAQRGNSVNSTRNYGRAASLFMHGAFHMAQYLYGWPFDSTLVENAIYITFAIAFVSAFGVGSDFGGVAHIVGLVAVIEVVRRSFVTLPFVFAYTNFWIYALASVTGAVRGMKSGEAPSMAVALLLIAGVLVPFAESTLCNSGFKDLGGHAIFDATVGLATVADAFVEAPVSSDKAKKQ